MNIITWLKRLFTKKKQTKQSDTILPPKVIPVYPSNDHNMGRTTIPLCISSRPPSVIIGDEVVTSRQDDTSAVVFEVALDALSSLLDTNTAAYDSSPTIDTPSSDNSSFDFGGGDGGGGGATGDW